MTKAVILSGGIDIPSFSGLDDDLPRSLLPVANIPLLYYPILTLSQHGVSEVFITCESGREALFKKWLEPVESRIRISYIAETYPLGTAGALLSAAKNFSSDPFWVIDGGVIANLNLSMIESTHRQNRSVATVVAQRLDFPEEGIRLDQSGHVEKVYRFHKSRDRRKSYIPSGIYLFNPEVLVHIDKKGYFDIKEQLLPRLYENELPVRVHEVSGEDYVRRVRSLSDYYHANWEMVDHNIINDPVTINEDKKMVEDKVWVGENTTVSASSSLIGPIVIGRGSKIGENCRVIGPAVIGDEVTIKDGATLRESVVLSGSTIPERSRIDYKIWTGEEGLHVFRKGGAPWHKEVKVSGQRSHASFVPSKKNTLFSSGKRFMDIIFSTIGLVVLSPLLLLIAIAIRLDSPGPAFYIQRRCGIYGREFPMVKFRTMIREAEQMQAGLSQRKDVDGPVFKMGNDPRITRFGRLLRKTSLDELPQLWNVLKGEMSLVGPRPLIMDEMKFNPKWRDLRLMVKPGMTGLWQIKGKHDFSFHHWLLNDLKYIKDYSIGLDLIIILKTLKSVLKQQG